MATRTLLTAIVILAAGAFAQAPARRAFEVASLKLNTSCSGGEGSGLSPGRLSLECVHMRNLIRAAYGMFEDDGTLRPRQIQVIGGPAWLDSDNYQVNAKAADGAPVNQTVGTMLRALLEDRCSMLSAVGRPVIDRTGITGQFDIHLAFTPPAILDAQQRQNGVAPIIDASAPSVFTAIQEELGLKLTPDKGAEDVLVIDSIERPSEN